MSGNKWGLAGPPPEAYSRVTDPGRFQPLHPVALSILERLEAQFDVGRVEGFGLDEEMEKVDLARPIIKLTPVDTSAAPIVVAFMSFPGLMVRCGRWLVMTFPACGCDACDETAEREERRLTELIDNVVSGRFRESIRIPFLGSARQECVLGSANPHWPAWFSIDRSRARALVGKGSRSFDWQPWPRRRHQENSQSREGNR